MGYAAALGPVLGAMRFLGGGSPANAASAGAPSPFDNAWAADLESTSPPVPERNPAFAFDKDLFGSDEAKVVSRKPASPPVPERNPAFAFDKDLFGSGDTPAGEPSVFEAPSGGVPLPGRNEVLQGDEDERQARAARLPDRVFKPSAGAPGNYGYDALAGLTVQSVLGRDVTGMPHTQIRELMQEDRQASPSVALNADAQSPLPQKRGQTDIARSAFDEDMPAPIGGVTDIPRRGPAPSGFKPGFDTSPLEPESSNAFDGLESGVGYVQDWLGESPTNPLFQTGMALLSSGYDGSNPFTGMQTGLNDVQKAYINQSKSDMERRKGEAEIADARRQKQLQEALTMIASLYGSGSGEGPASQRSKGQASLIR